MHDLILIQVKSYISENVLLVLCSYFLKWQYFTSWQIPKAV